MENREKTQNNYSRAISEDGIYVAVDGNDGAFNAVFENENYEGVYAFSNLFAEGSTLGESGYQVEDPVFWESTRKFEGWMVCEWVEETDEDGEVVFDAYGGTFKYNWFTCDENGEIEKYEWTEEALGINLKESDEKIGEQMDGWLEIASDPVRSDADFEGWLQFTMEIEDYFNESTSDDSFGDADVYRIAGDNRYETAFLTADVLKEQMGVDQFDTVIVACGTNFADALGGSYLASEKNAPILLANVKKAEDLREYIKENLVEGGTIYVLGGEVAVPSSILEGMDDYVIKRLSGENRYETNLAILNEVKIQNDDIMVCTGKDFADSLSVSALGNPILLVKDELTQEQKKFMRSLPGNFYYIIGGEKAVSAKIEEQVWEIEMANRIGGENRYETSVMVAEIFFDDPKTAVLAYAKNFPDGLCGGPLAMSKDAPLILTATGKQNVAAEYTKEYGITKGAVLGGSKLISDNAVKKIFSVDEIENW